MNTLFSQGQLGKSVVVLAVIAMWGFCGSTIHAKPLGHATVTQVNNDVRFKPGAGEERAAKPKDVVKGSDTVRTGQKSQAELEFEDRTITRLGSNSTFTFDPDKREFQLKKGLLLFDMPKGRRWRQDHYPRRHRCHRRHRRHRLLSQRAEDHLLGWRH